MTSLIRRHKCRLTLEGVCSKAKLTYSTSPGRFAGEEARVGPASLARYDPFVSKQIPRTSSFGMVQNAGAGATAVMHDQRCGSALAPGSLREVSRNALRHNFGGMYTKTLIWCALTNSCRSSMDGRGYLANILAHRTGGGHFIGEGW
jgi:hypothetical protein